MWRSGERGSASDEIGRRAPGSVDGWWRRWRVRCWGCGGPGWADGCGCGRGHMYSPSFTDKTTGVGVVRISCRSVAPDTGVLSLHSREMCHLLVLALISRICTQQGSHLLYVCHAAVIIVMLISKSLYLTDCRIVYRVARHATRSCYVSAPDGTIGELLHPRNSGLVTAPHLPRPSTTLMDTWIDDQTECATSS